MLYLIYLSSITLNKSERSFVTITISFNPTDVATNDCFM